MEPHEWQELGLYDPDAPDAADQLVVLDTLVAHGIGVDEIRAAIGRPRELTRLLRDGLLWDDRRRVTLAELAEQAGLPLDVVRRVRLMFGLPDPGDEPLCRVAELELLRAYSIGVAQFGEDSVLEYARVIGAAVRAVGDASMTLFVSNIGVPMQDAGATEAQYARRSFDASGAFRVVPRLLDILARMHFELSIDELYPIGPLSTTTDAVIGFVDLVDSTVLTRQTETKMLHRSLAEFEQFAVIRALALGGRIVKLIGDEVMFVAHTPESGVRIACDLVAFSAEHLTLAGARGGVAFGPVTPRDGDYFGTVVNLAARLAALADAGDVLVDAETAAALAADATESLGARELKGFDERVAVYRALGEDAG